MNVFDASALLAFLQGEEGSDVVEAQLITGGSCGAANWSEIAQQVIAANRSWKLGRALLLDYGLVVEPVSVEDAEWAAHRWNRGEGLSLGDRLCLALGHRLQATVWTADRRWDAVADGVRQIR